MYRLEICANGLLNALTAELCGAHRIELCENLESGGLTPSFGTLEMAAERIKIPTHVLIRPRRGNYVYDKTERELMLRDIDLVRRLGLAGVVIGALDHNGSIDLETLKVLKEAAGELSVTFHRAIDVCMAPEKAIESLIRLGIPRLLTSGGAPTAYEGISRIAAWQQSFGQHIAIMAGSGINNGNALEIIKKTGVREIHTSAKTLLQPVQHQYLQPSEPSHEWWHYGIDEQEIHKIRSMLDELSAPNPPQP